MTSLRGIIPIAPTIFTADGAVDERGTRRVVEYMIASGADGIAFPGLASEHETLTMKERLRLTAQVGSWIGGRCPFIVGASASTTDESVRYAVAGAEAGASVAMVMAPRLLANDIFELVRFFELVCRQASISVMLQNAPAPIGVGLRMADVAKISRQVEGVRYVKEEAPPSGQRITELAELSGNSLDAIFGGAGARYVIDELARGAKGAMPACEITELHVEMFNHFQAGNEAQARNLFERTLPLLSMQAVFRWRLTKEVLRRRGIIESSFVRAAGPALDRHDCQELNALLARLSDVLPLDRVPSLEAAS